VGYDQVILISSEAKTRRKVRELTSTQLEKENLGKILFLQPEEFVSYLEEQEAEAADKEGTVRGYRVKAKYKASHGSGRRRRASRQSPRRSAGRSRGAKRRVNEGDVSWFF